MDFFGFIAIVFSLIVLVRTSNVIGRVNKLERKIEMLERESAAGTVVPQEKPLDATQMPSISVPVSKIESAASVSETISKPISMEHLFGGNIVTKIGIIALLFGFGFLFKYAYDNAWIGPIGVTMLGILVGIIFLVAGEYFHGKYRVYAQTLTGGGIGVLYLSLFAAFALYHLVGQLPVFFLIIGITAMSGILAIRYDALALAVVGIIGGFLTPFLVSTGNNNLAGLFTYIAVLDIGILAIAIFKQWRELNLVGLVGTFLVFLAWFMRFYTHDQLGQTQFFITVFFVIFSLSTIVYLLFRTLPIVSLDMLMMVGVPTAYALVSYNLLDRDYHAYMGFFAVALALWYFLLAFLGYQINRSDKNLVNGLLLVALIFVTVAVPLQLEQSWITMIWALEACALLVIGLLAAQYHLRLFALIVIALTVVRLFMFELSVGNLIDYTVIFNKRFFIFLAVVLVMSAMALAYRLLRKDQASPDFSFGKALFAVSQLLLFIILTMEILTYWDRESLLLSNEIRDRAKQETFIQNNRQPAYTYGYPGSVQGSTQQDRDAFAAIGNKRNISLSVFWVLYGVLALALGIALKNKYMRMAAIGLFGLVILKVFLVDMGSLTGFYRITSFIGLGVILIIVGFVYQRFKAQIYEFIT